MYIGISLIIYSLLHSLLISFLFFIKPHITSGETKLYKNLMIVNIVNLLLELGCFATIANSAKIPILAFIISRLFLISLLIWDILFTIYTFYLCFIEQSNKKDFFKKLCIFECFMFIICLFIILFSPLNYYYENNTMYSYGFGADVVTTIYSLNLVLALILAFVKFKTLKSFFFTI